MKTGLKIAPLILLLAACTTVPTGPSKMALPGSNKSFEQFRYDDSLCRQFALDQIGGSSAGQAGESAGVKSAVVGTAVGAVAGAALGGRDGAAAGAGVGLITGASAGSGAAQASAYGTQRQYDNAYVQCMYAKGHKVPIDARMLDAPAVQNPPASYVPPPPPPKR